MPARPQLPTITHLGREYRLPFASLFRELTADELARLTASVSANGVRYPVMVYDSPAYGPDCVIDGMNRLKLAAELSLLVPKVGVPDLSDAEAEQLAVSLNADRRHLSAADYQKLSADRAARLKRVTTARAGGKSLRTIAAAEHISVGQAQRDLAKVQDPAPGKTIASASEPGVSTPIHLDETPVRIIGQDGREQPAKKKPRAAKPDPKPKAEADPEAAAATAEPAAPETPVAFWHKPEDVAAGVRAALRKLRDIKLTVSAVLDSPFRPIAEKAAEPHGLTWAWDGEHQEHARHLNASLVSRTYSCPPLDLLVSFLADLQAWLLKDGRAVPVYRDDRAPWEQLGRDTEDPADPDTVPI